MLQFDLCKEASAPLSFSLSKIQKYIVELHWDSKQDLDVHAIGLVNGKITSAQNVLSTYNPQLVLCEDVTKRRTVGSKQAFQNESGSLKHFGDSRTGIQISGQAPDEVLEIDLPKLVNGENEVSFFVTSHPPNKVKFSEVNDAKLIIKDDSGEVLLIANLTSDFDQYDMVQMGSLVLNPANQAWEFNPVAVGLNGTFNDIMAMLQ